MMNVADKRMLEREALRNMIQQWNANRLDLFELSEPNENLEFHGVMRFYFQDSGQKIATKCIRVASDATVSDVIETLIEKFRPDMRMLSLPSYALYEVLATHEERRLSQNEKPLLVQLNWHADDREGRFLLKCVDQSEMPTNNNASDTSNQNFKRKLSKREKKELKKKEKISRMKSDATNEEEKAVAEKLYTELPETSFTRSISNPEAVMRRRRHQKLERKLQQFRSKDGGPDTGGTLKIYGESLCPDVPYKTLLLSVGDCAAHVVREMLEKYGLGKNDPQQFCLMQVNAEDNSEYALDDDDCPLAIVMTHPHRGSIMFHVRRRPADCQPRRRKKKSVGGGGGGGPVGNAAAVHHAHHHHPPRDSPFLVEVAPDGTVLDSARQLRLTNDVIEVGSGNGMTLQLYGPSIQPRHCVVAPGGADGVATLTPLHADAELYVNGQRVYHTAVLQHGCLIKFGRVSTFRFVDPAHENKLSRNLSQSQHFDSGSIYDRSPTSPIPDNASGILSSQSINNHQFENIHSPMEGIANSTANVDFQRAMSPLGNQKLGSQDNFNYGSKTHIDLTDSMSPYNNNNNSLKMDDESLIMSQHFANSKSDLLQDNHFASPYNEHEQQMLSKSGSGSGGLKDNYETTFDLDGNVETKSICSAKSGGSGHEPRSSQQMAQRGQEAILPAVLEFPEVGQQQFLHAVITRLDVNVPAFKLAPVYTLYLCARYRASTHYRPELSPTERAHKLTALLHHVATLIQNVIQERQSEASWQAFWMANGSELLHFLKCDRHIAAFSLQAQEALALAVHAAFANLVGCLQAELAPRLGPFLAEERDDEAVAPAVHVLAGAMALLRRCRVNAALTIQLFSHLFHYINAYCYNKLVTTPAMCTARWGTITASRLSQLAGWAEIQGLELAADCHLARLQQVAYLLQAPKNTPDDIAAITSTCFKLNSVQLHQLMSSFVFENGSPVRSELIELAVQHAMSVADELYKADGREITLEESTDLGVQLLVPGDGYSGDVVRGVPPALQDFIAPLQRARLCRLTLQPHSRGAWTVYMNGYHGGSMSMKPTSQQPVVQVIQLHKNTNGMGLSIVAAKGAGQSRLGIYIKSVVSGGAAAADGRLQAGDQLLSVDGQSLQGITQEKAAEFLVRTGPVVTLEVAKQGAVLHGLATLLQQPSPQTNREEEEGARRHSGTFTNFSPVFLRKTRPESEMVTTYHDSAYAKGLGIPDRHSVYYSQQPGARRASERDLPSRLESESGAMQVKPSKSVPALHEQTRQHEVFNPGYSRTSSNNSIPTMAGLKSRSSHNLSAPLSPGVQPNIHPHAHHHHNQQNAGVEQGFYQNISTYKNPPTQQQQLGDRFSNLRSSQNGLQLQGLQNLPPKQSPMQASPSLQMPPNLGQQHSNTLGPQRPQSAYYQQGQTSTIPPTNGMRSAQSSKDLPGSYDGPNQVRGSYPSMPNVNQGYAPNGPQYHQNQYPSGGSSQGNVNYNRPPQHAGQSSFRGQAKLAEMSEEVTRRQQRGPMSPAEAQGNQNNRFQYNADSYNRLSNGPLSPSAIQNSPTKQQPPVAPKPSGPKRVISGDMAVLESEGPPLPPTNTHPQFHTPNTDEDGAYLASALDPPALSVYPAHHSHPHPNQQRAPPGTAPNPWQREEREKEAMARRAAGRARRDAALAALVALGNSRSPLQTQQLRALQLERDFERRAATEMSNDNNEDKELQDQQGPLSPMNGGGLLRLANTNNQQHNLSHQMGNMSQSVSMQQLEAAAGINLVPVSSNVVSSIQPVSIVTSNINGGDQQPDSPAGQQTPVPNYPPPPPPTQPKSILKSNLRLENLNTNSPQSPSKSHKNASFSSNLTPQSLKFDQMQPEKYEQSPPNKLEQNMLSKYDPNVPKYAEQQTPTMSKYDQNSYSSSVQNLSKYDPNISVNQLSQNISSLNVSNHERHSREIEMRYEEQTQAYVPFDPQSALPPLPPERGSSFAVMSQAQQLRSNLSSSQQSMLSPTSSHTLSNNLRDKRVSFHDRDQNAASSVEQINNELNMEIIREDPDRFIAEAENMLQSPTTPTGASATHTPGVIGAQEVYRDPRQRRLLAEQQQKQQQNTPIPEKLTFQEKMKMFALESGENNTPKDKVKISRAQRDIDAVH